MTKKVYVTRAQARAASAIVERSALTGRHVRPGVAKIAAVSSGTRHRSAITGKYVQNDTAVRHPNTNVPDSERAEGN